MASLKLSAEVQHLDEDSRKRYVAKLDLVGMTDPYNLPRGLLKSPELLSLSDLPELSYIDICNYIINSPSPYTGKDLKAYKSLDAYKYFTAGWVHDGLVWKIPNRDCFLLMTKVKHSQCLNKPSLKPWVALQKDGQIICCHCTCMAGLGETCSHATASMFALETLVRMKASTTCTSLPCQWLKPSSYAVEYAEGSNINFCNPAKKPRSSGSTTTTTDRVTKLPQKQITSPTADERAAFYKALSDTGTRSAILSIVPNYAQNFTPRPVVCHLPTPLTDLYDPCNLELNAEELKAKCQVEVKKLHVTQDQVSAVEKETLKQCNSKMWYNQRAGRVTASNFKAATRTNVCKPSRSLIQRICYPKMCSFSTVATRWGCDHEQDAKIQYDKIMTTKHSAFKVQETGFHISNYRPYFGASPDGLVSCECCGEGCLEVKCPFCIKEKEVEQVASESKTFCLEKDASGNYVLHQNHQYYYQVQAQLYCTNRRYCDFLVWKENQLLIERVPKDESFLARELPKVDKFFSCCVMPELLAKIHSSPSVRANPKPAPGSAEQVCYCRNPPSDDMLQCESGKCDIKSFHKKCLGIKRIPKHWLCPNCKKSENQQKRQMNEP